MPKILPVVFDEHVLNVAINVGVGTYIADAGDLFDAEIPVAQET